MTIYDALMLGAVVLGLIWGAWRGLISQVASLSSLVLGYVIAHPVSAHLVPYIPAEPIVARGVAMLVVYVMATVGVFLIAGLIRALVKTLKLSALDRQLGLMLGAVEGAVVGLIVTLFVVSLAPESREPIFSSPTGRVVGRLMDHVGPVMPDEARKVLAKFWDPDWKPGVRMVAQVADRTREENIAAKPDDTAGESSWGLFERDGESPARNSRPRTGRRGDSDDTNDARPRRR